MIIEPPRPRTWLRQPAVDLFGLDASPPGLASNLQRQSWKAWRMMLRMSLAGRWRLGRPSGRWWRGRRAAGALVERSPVRHGCPGWYTAGVRRGGRADECDGLENRYARKRTGGSNPSPSATNDYRPRPGGGPPPRPFPPSSPDSKAR